MGSLAFAVGSSFVALAALGYYVAYGFVQDRSRTRERLAVYGRNAARDPIRQKELRRPFAERALGPLVQAAGRLGARVTPIGWIERTDHRLLLAGGVGRLDANSWAVIKVGATLAGLGAWFLIRADLDPTGQAAALAGLVALGFFGPEVYLNRRIHERSVAMLKQLPDILDLLVISVEAGLGFDASLTRVVQTVPGPLSDEFHRMLQEARVGMARRDAMRALRDRTNVEELRGFLLAMVQADSFGVPIARVLRVQAEEMRIKRRQRAQERAFAAPVKMVFPLMLLISSFMLVLMGPAFLEISSTLLNR